MCRDVVLPLDVVASEDVQLSELTVNWQTNSREVVHSFHRCKDALDLQAERFHGRTKVFPEKNGNVSLQLRDVTLNDTGTYHVYLFYHNCKPIERTFRLTVTGMSAQ